MKKESCCCHSNQNSFYPFPLLRIAEQLAAGTPGTSFRASGSKNLCSENQHTKTRSILHKLSLQTLSVTVTGFSSTTRSFRPPLFGRAVHRTHCNHLLDVPEAWNHEKRAFLYKDILKSTYFFWYRSLCPHDEGPFPFVPRLSVLDLASTCASMSCKIDKGHQFHRGTQGKVINFIIENLR
jgi:hypothetical protein